MNKDNSKIFGLGRVFLTIIICVVISLLYIWYLVHISNKVSANWSENNYIVPKDNDKQVTNEDPDEVKDKVVENKTTDWHEIINISGEAMKTTETFHIPSKEWKISWDTKSRKDEYGTWPSNFVIIVYNDGGEMVDLVANVVGNNKDYSIMREGGDYYLKINSGQPYSIIVEAKY